MGMTEEQFYDSTFRSFFNRLTGYRRKEEREYWEHWERLRWQTTQLLNLHLPKGKEIKETDLLLLPSERPKTPKKKITGAEAWELTKHWDKL